MLFTFLMHMSNFVSIGYLQFKQFIGDIAIDL